MRPLGTLLVPVILAMLLAGPSADCAPPQRITSVANPAPQSNATQSQAPAPTQSPVADDKASLIARVEEKFASGEQNFKAGHLDAARRDFDAAVDWMLESGYDPNSDPKLSELFHRVVDTVYTYELQAFRAGDGKVRSALGRC